MLICREHDHGSIAIYVVTSKVSPSYQKMSMRFVKHIFCERLYYHYMIVKGKMIINNTLV